MMKWCRTKSKGEIANEKSESMKLERFSVTSKKMTLFLLQKSYFVFLIFLNLVNFLHFVFFFKKCDFYVLYLNLYIPLLFYILLILNELTIWCR